MRDLSGESIGIDPAHKDLRAARFSITDVKNSFAIGGPAGVRAFGEKPVLAAIDVHDPEGRIPAVFNLVGLLAGVNNTRAIGRNLGIADSLEVEVMIIGETRGGT